MTIPFPRLAPSEHPTIIAGRFPHVEKRSTGGRVRRIGLSNVQLDGRILLTYSNISTEELFTLLGHWRLVRGTTLNFRLPAELFPSTSSSTRNLLMATAWKYKEGPKVVDICGGQPEFLLHSLEFTLVAQPRRVASPVLASVPELSLPVVPVTAPGAHWSVSAVFTPGTAGTNTITLPGAAWVLSPVWLPGAASTPGTSTAPGAAWALSVEFTPGPATTPSAGLNISIGWATGIGSITGVAPGAAWTNNVALAAGAASVSLVVAPGAALAAGVAWAPGSASITGGTAPGALLALATGWQPGGAQGIAPGADWSVSVVWAGGAGSVPGTDPNFSSVSLLLPLNSSFADFSGNNFTPSIVGTGVSISTATSKYGAGAAYFNNAGYVSFGQQNALLFDGDFTIECWVRLDALNQNHTIGSSSNASNTQIFRFGYAGYNLVTCYINDQFVVNAVNSGTQAQVWQHLALCRSGLNTRFFADGDQVGATYTSNFGTFRMDVIGATIWSGGDLQYLKGHVDDLRARKTALYTSNFTPTGPHPTS